MEVPVKRLLKTLYNIHGCGAKFKYKKLSEENPTFINGICADLRTLSVYSQGKEVTSECPEETLLESAVPQILNNPENELDIKMKKVDDAVKLVREIKLRDERLQRSR